MIQEFVYIILSYKKNDSIYAVKYDIISWVINIVTNFPIRFIKISNLQCFLLMTKLLLLDVL